MSRVTFGNRTTPFFSALKEKVDQYFKDQKLHTSGNSTLFIKGLLQVFSAVTLYIVLVFFTPGTLVSIMLCFLLGITFAVIGFNIMHEGAHQSFSQNKWINKLSAYSLNAMGGNSHFWKVK